VDIVPVVDTGVLEGIGAAVGIAVAADPAVGIAVAADPAVAYLL